MKFLHTADWHIGRRLNGHQLLDEQQHAFEEMLKIAEQEDVDAIVIAGDLYDRSVPSVESVALLNEMMIEMNLERNLPVLAVSGNHDSPTRLATGSQWLKEKEFHLHTTLKQALNPIEIKDTQFFLLPYIEPFHGRQLFKDETLMSVASVIERTINEMRLAFDANKKQVLVGHFFAAGSIKSESETPLEVGGLSSVPLDLFADFDYVALGHLHYKDAIKHVENIKYSGSLLKYSLSEVNQEKGIRLVELSDAGVSSEFIEIKPLHDVLQIVGNFEELTDKDYYDKLDREVFIAITLTDEQPVPNALSELRGIYPRLISLERKKQLKAEKEIDGHSLKKINQMSPEKLVEDYFSEVTGTNLTAKQTKWLEEAMVDVRSEK